MKYIVFESKLEDGMKILIPVIFPTILVHSTVAQGMPEILDNHGFSNAKPVGAGDCVITAKCSGRSESMQLSSRPEDTDLISYHDYTAGLEDDDSEVMSEEEKTEYRLDQYEGR